MMEQVEPASDIEDCMREFMAKHEHYKAAKDSIYNAIAARLKDDGLNYHVVQHRVKDPDSLRAKLARTGHDGSPKYRNGLDDIVDMIGLRVITYLEGDVERAMEALTGWFTVLERVDKRAEQKQKGTFGYSGQHIVFQIDESNPAPGCSEHHGQRFEVQFRTILQHAWAEFEHDVRYKGANHDRPEVNRAFTLASGLIELADREFSNIDAAVKAQTVDENPAARASDEVLTGEGLQELLDQFIPGNPRSRTEQYAWLVELLEANGVASLSAAAELLASVDWESIADRISYKFRPGHVRIVDDYLLDQWGQDYVERTQDVGNDVRRREKLEHRLRKLRE
ncbi:GTP pyrophosphokinase [Arthrobacter pigmenti]